jgi:hypothetical protein
LAALALQPVRELLAEYCGGDPLLSTTIVESVSVLSREIPPEISIVRLS